MATLLRNQTSDRKEVSTIEKFSPGTANRMIIENLLSVCFLVSFNLKLSSRTISERLWILQRRNNKGPILRMADALQGAELFRHPLANSVC